MLGAVDTTRVIVVEFGKLDRWQQILVDLHRLRALGVSDLPEDDPDRSYAAFWLEEGTTAEDVYAEISRWANRHGLPNGRLADRRV